MSDLVKPPFSPGSISPEKPKLSPKRLPGRAVITIGIVAVILIGWLGASQIQRVNHERAKKAAAAAKAERLANAVKIGTFPYVTACRMVPAADVEKIFQPLGDPGQFSEAYLAKSLPTTYFTGNKRTSYVDSECSYSLYGTSGTKTYNVLSVNVKYYSDVKTPREEWLRKVANTAANNEAELQKLKDTMPEEFADGSGDRILESLKNQIGYKDPANDPVLVPGLDGSVFFDPKSVSYTILRKNMLIKIAYKKGTFSGIANPDRYTPEEFAQMNEKIADMLPVIDKAFSRSKDEPQDKPASTIISTQRRVGEVNMVEPCAVFTPAVFSQTFGKDPGSSIRTNSTFKNASFSGKNSFGQELYSSNQCSYSQIGDLTTDRSYFGGITVEYRPNVQLAKDYLVGVEDSMRKSPNYVFTKPKTKFDAAVVGQSPEGTSVYLRYKSAVITVNLTIKAPYSEEVTERNIPVELSVVEKTLAALHDNLQAAQVSGVTK